MRSRECQIFQAFRFPVQLLFGLIVLLSMFACGGSEAAKQQHLTRGEQLIQKRKFQQAAMEFRAAADIDKSSAAAHYGLSRVYENQGRLGEAIQELQQTARLAPENLEARAKLGNYFLATAPPQIGEAERTLAEIFAVDPQYVEGVILNASILSAQKKNAPEIIAVFNRALEIAPRRIETYLSLARFQMKEQNAAEADRALQKALEIDAKSVLALVEYGRFFDFAGRKTEAESQFIKAVASDPQSYDARAALAEFYYTDRQFDKAETAYKNLAEMLENSPEGLSELAEFYVGVGREDEAIKTYEAILEDEPDYAAARYRLGEIYLELKQYEKVSEQVEKLLTVNDTDAEALMLRARVKIQSNQTEEAIRDLEEVLKRQPSLKSALFYMAQARLALGQIDLARAFIGDLEKYHPQYLYSKLLKIQSSFTAAEPSKALQQCNELLAALKNTYPTADTPAQALEQLRVKTISARGLAFLELGKTAESRADLQEIVRLSPNSAAALVNLAKVSAAQNNAAEALAFYEKAATLDKSNFDALTGAVGLLKQQGQFAQAHEKLNRAVAENSADKNMLAALHYLNADVYKAENDSAAAEAELLRAIELDNEYLPAYSAYAELLIKRNQIDGAVEQYQKVVEKKQSASVYTLIGMLEDARQNYDESERNYRKALEITPEMPIAANNLAWNIAALDRGGNLDEALTLAQRVVDRNTNNAGFYDTLGWIYYKKGLLSPAVEQLRKAVAIDDANAAGKPGKPVNPAYRLRLGQALASAGDKSSARREVELALENEQNLSMKDAVEAKNFLNNL